VRPRLSADTLFCFPTYWPPAPPWLHFASLSRPEDPPFWLDWATANRPWHGQKVAVDLGSRLSGKVCGFRYSAGRVPRASHQQLGVSSAPIEELGAALVGISVSGRVARPFGSALTDLGRRLSRTRLFPRVTRITPRLASKGE
jgi:hypothetical protein